MHPDCMGETGNYYPETLSSTELHKVLIGQVWYRAARQKIAVQQQGDQLT